MTRQQERAYARHVRKDQLTEMKRRVRAGAKRELLERQSRREKAGVYTGLSVGKMVRPSRSTPIAKQRIRKGKPFGRLIREYVVGGIEITLHATKGWRRVCL